MIVKKYGHLPQTTTAASERKAQSSIAQKSQTQEYISLSTALRYSELVNRILALKYTQPFNMIDIRSTVAFNSLYSCTPLFSCRFCKACFANLLLLGIHITTCVEFAAKGKESIDAPFRTVHCPLCKVKLPSLQQLAIHASKCKTVTREHQPGFIGPRTMPAKMLEGAYFFLEKILPAYEQKFTRFMQPHQEGITGSPPEGQKKAIKSNRAQHTAALEDEHIEEQERQSAAPPQKEEQTIDFVKPKHKHKHIHNHRLQGPETDDETEEECLTLSVAALRNDTELAVYKCSFCTMTTSDIEEYGKHIFFKHKIAWRWPDTEFINSLRQYRGQRSKSSLDATEERDYENFIVCRFCGTVMSSFITAGIHYLNCTGITDHHPEPLRKEWSYNYHCPCCSETFSVFSAYLKHMSNHTTIRRTTTKDKQQHDGRTSVLPGAKRSRETPPQADKAHAPTLHFAHIAEIFPFCCKVCNGLFAYQCDVLEHISKTHWFLKGRCEQLIGKVPTNSNTTSITEKNSHLVAKTMYFIRVRLPVMPFFLPQPLGILSDDQQPANKKMPPTTSDAQRTPLQCPLPLQIDQQSLSSIAQQLQWRQMLIQQKELQKQYQQQMIIQPQQQQQLQLQLRQLQQQQQRQRQRQQDFLSQFSSSQILHSIEQKPATLVEGQTCSDFTKQRNVKSSNPSLGTEKELERQKDENDSKLSGESSSETTSSDSLDNEMRQDATNNAVANSTAIETNDPQCTEHQQTDANSLLSVQDLTSEHQKLSKSKREGQTHTQEQSLPQTEETQRLLLLQCQQINQLCEMQQQQQQLFVQLSQQQQLLQDQLQSQQQSLLQLQQQLQNQQIQNPQQQQQHHHHHHHQQQQQQQQQQQTTSQMSFASQYQRYPRCQPLPFLLLRKQEREKQQKLQMLLEQQNLILSKYKQNKGNTTESQHTSQNNVLQFVEHDDDALTKTDSNAPTVQERIIEHDEAAKSDSKLVQTDEPQQDNSV